MAHGLVAALTGLPLAVTASCGAPAVDHRAVAQHVRAAPVTLQEACRRVDDELPRGPAAPPAYAEVNQVLVELAGEGTAATRAAIDALRPGIVAMAGLRRTSADRQALDDALARFAASCARGGSGALL